MPALASRIFLTGTCQAKITMIIVEKVITNGKVEERIKELKPIHPELAK
jgi:hypothetical protein